MCKKRWKRIAALGLIAVLAASSMTGCRFGFASDPDDENAVEEEEPIDMSVDTFSYDKSLDGTKITLLNSKAEIQVALEKMGEIFEEKAGVHIDVMPVTEGDSPYTKTVSMYNSGSAPTMAILDTTDVEALATEYALDLSDEKWTQECVGQLTTVDGKIYSFPFCIEGRGLIYNKTAIEDTLGTSFDPSTINSYDALKELLESLRSAGMENPVVLSKEDWSLGNHQLGFIYDTYDGTTSGSAELIDQLKSGELKVEDYERFDQFIDTFDLLCEYNINGEDPLGALYDQDPIFLADGDAAIWANGSWAWPNLAEAGADTGDEYGFLPFVLGNDTSDFANNGIEAAATKQLMIDAEQSTEEQQAAAKEFLNWLVYSDNGQRMLVEDAAVIPACSNNTYEALDPLSKDIQTKMGTGKTYSSCFIAPADHWSVLGASMQKYLGGENTKDELAAEIDAYWTSQE